MKGNFCPARAFVPIPKISDYYYNNSRNLDICFKSKIHQEAHPAFIRLSLFKLIAPFFFYIEVIIKVKSYLSHVT